MTTWDDLLRPGEASNFFQLPGRQPFQPNAAVYDRANAWWLMELSRLVYRNEPDRPAILDGAGLHEVAFFDRNGTQAFLVESKDGTWAALVFRGSDDLQAWMTNSEALPIPIEQGSPEHVHGGFKEALAVVWSDIERQLLNIRTPIFYAGHSLGAALATLASARHAPHATYTFGSPAVGNAAFAATIHTPIFRVVDDRDIVPTLPPPALGYEHVGSLVTLRSPHPLVHGFHFDPLELFREAAEPPEFLADHAPINYVKRIP